MADNGNGNPTAGGSGAGRNVPVQAQNVVIDANAQAAAAQMAQQILANTNVTLKQSKFRTSGEKKAKTRLRLHNLWPGSTNVKSQMTGTTQPPTQISACASEERLTNGWLPK